MWQERRSPYGSTVWVQPLQVLQRVWETAGVQEQVQSVHFDSYLQGSAGRDVGEGVTHRGYKLGQSGL